MFLDCQPARRTTEIPAWGASFLSHVPIVCFLFILSHFVLWRPTVPQCLICVALEMGWWWWSVESTDIQALPIRTETQHPLDLPAPASGSGCLFSRRSRLSQGLGKNTIVPQWCPSWLPWVGKGHQQRSYQLFNLEMVKQNCSWLWPPSPAVVSTAQIGERAWTSKDFLLLVSAGGSRVSIYHLALIHTQKLLVLVWPAVI